MNRASLHPQRRDRGFTIIELMIVTVLVVVLASLAVPSFLDSVRKSRRSEAFNALAAVQQAQERSRGNFPAYCPNLASAPTSTTCGLALPATSVNQRYAIALDGTPTANGYVATATAQGAQASDTQCAKLGVRINEGTVSYGSGSSTIDWTDSNRCWAK